MADATDNIVHLSAPFDPILRCIGAARPADNDRALLFVFDRAPSDDEMRFLHDVMRRAAVMSRSGGDHG